MATVKSVAICVRAVTTSPVSVIIAIIIGILFMTAVFVNGKCNANNCNAGGMLAANTTHGMRDKV